MKQQLNEVQQLQKIAGILNENFLAKRKKEADILAKKIKSSGVSLDSIKKGLARTFKDEPFDDPRFVNRTIKGLENAESLEQLAGDVKVDSDGYFDERDLYDLILDLIDQGTIK
jgi:hypothetical protein